MKRPETNEFAPYYDRYISLIDGDDVMPILSSQIAEIRSMMANLPEERGSYAYAEGKWTIKELLSHVIDGERIFSYRLLRISRGDKTPIEGFEQDDYIANSNANGRSFADLIDELDLQRRANLLMMTNVSEDGEKLMGTASDKPVSVRALAYMMAGHVTHHINILKERYLA